MRRIVFNVALLAGCMCAAMLTHAMENDRGGNKPATKPKATYKDEASDCVSAAAQFDLDINNVRARILTGGDLWWNFSEAKYEVPKGDLSGKPFTSIFAGAIWITGFDAPQGGNLKCASQRYRENGDDFWPGPIRNGSVDKATCSKYDRFFNVYGNDIAIAQTNFLQKGPQTTVADIPKGVLAWPAKGNPYLASDNTLIGETFVINDNLAPFYDYDNDDKYDPTQGDYPVIKCARDTSGGRAYADQMIFWVFNDLGNLHSETSGQAIGVQINAMAFAFQTTDEINNMTFYKYEIINKGATPLYETYISQWVDPDLGCYADDRVGCDVNRSLGICYNSASPDVDCVSERGYGTQLPIVGMDFFEGPLSDQGAQLGLSSFTYFTGIGADPSRSDPQTAQQYRNYQTCRWADGSYFTQTGDGGDQNNPRTCFVFPGNPIDPGAWSDYTSPLAPGDRRFVQTSGPFTLTPGTAQYVTVGCVFVRPAGINGVGVPPDFETTIGPADDKAQLLFNSCFKLTDGPDAPTLAIRELENQIIINLVNKPGSNNYGESYNEFDALTASGVQELLGGVGDTTYTFEGYLLYQVANPTVSAQDIKDQDESKAKLIAEVDVKNGITRMLNYVEDASLGGLLVPTPLLKTKTEFDDDGITSTFRITQDLFATGSQTNIVNNKTYYFAALAFAYNNYKQYDQSNPQGKGQLTTYILGRNNFKIYSAIPHKPDPNNNGTVLNSIWGEGVEVKRIQGSGNGGNNLHLTKQTIADIIGSRSYAFKDTLTYEKGADPIGVRVTDPVLLKEADFELQFVNHPDSPVGASTGWVLKDLTNNITIPGQRTLDRPYQQEIIYTDPNTGEATDYGFSVKLGTPTPVYQLPAGYPNGTFANRYVYDTLTSTIEFANPTEQWLSFVRDEGQNTVTNWVRSGSMMNNPSSQNAATKAAVEAFDDNWWYVGNSPPANPFGAVLMQDSLERFEKIADGRWAPYCLTANYSKKGITTPEINNGKPPFVYGPGFKWRNYGGNTPPQNTLDQLISVDFVITPDPQQWTRCIVFETGEDQALNIGGDLSPNGLSPEKGQLRMGISKVWHNDQTRDYLMDDPNGEVGRSWFPGYAINAETGERLNIAFGEATEIADQNGRDMFWNPTSQVYAPTVFPDKLISQIPYFGGKHFIYIMNTKYDEGEAARQLLMDYYTLTTSNKLINTALQPLYRSLTWTSIPYMSSNFQLQPDGAGNRIIPPDSIVVHLRVERPFDKFATSATSGFDTLPRYQFSTKGLGATEGNMDVAKSSLDAIKVVPNPYLAYSAYEIDQNSNRVKITNLPNKCDITIFSLDGTIIRRLSRAIDVDPATNRRIDIGEGTSTDKVNVDNTVDWDLKNDKGISIASGIYLIHVDAPGIGQRTLKWFGAIRPADTSGF